jgi:hypothetical protein
VKDGSLHCELDVSHQYDLIDAYRLDPHVQFLNCKSVDDLRTFTRSWGPLYLVQTLGAEEIKLGKAIRRLDECQAHWRWLRAVKGMIDACKGREDWRDSLVEFLTAEGDIDRTSNTYQPGKAPVFCDMFQLNFRCERDPISWTKCADLGSIKRALVFSVEVACGAPSSYGFRVEGRRKGLEIIPRFGLHTLWEALRWMMWMDEWNHCPPLPCSECHRIFRPSTAHKKKYCTHECAHRATNREWRRKDLRERKKKLKSKVKGGINGPGETR